MSGLDRRVFLGLLGGGAGSLALSPMSAITVDHDNYTNVRLGVMVRKPPSWHFVAIQDFARSLKEQEERVADPELQAELQELSGDPIVVISRYGDEEDRYTPTVQIYANPVEEYDWATFEEFGEDLVFAMEPYLQEYVPDGPAYIGRIDGFPAATVAARFVFEAEKVRYPSWLRSVNVLTDRSLFSITIAAAIEGPDSCRVELKDVERSLKFW